MNEFYIHMNMALEVGPKKLQLKYQGLVIFLKKYNVLGKIVAKGFDSKRWPQLVQVGMRW